MVTDPFEGSGITALGLAAARSVESGRSDRLIEDPFAIRLFDAAGRDLGMRTEWPGAEEQVDDREALHLHGSRYIGLRTRFYDDQVIDAAGAGIGQAVMFGAGLDTRAWRLEPPAPVRFFELDRPELLDFKAQALEDPPSIRSNVGADLRDEWEAALKTAGFDVSKPALWIAEGLMPYLSVLEQAALLGAVDGLSAPGSRIAFDRITGDASARAGELSARSGFDMQSMFAEGEGQSLGGLLEIGGWRTDEESVADVADRYGRDLSDPFASSSSGSEPPWLDTMFVWATLGDGRPRS